MRILIIKHGALGDIIQGLDAFASLRAGFPKAHIAVLTSQNFAPLMREMPYFNEVIIDKRAPFWQFWEWASIRAVLRQKFDMIIDLQCSKRTASYHRHLVPSGTRWLGTAKGCSDAYPDFTNVNNHKRMLTAATMLGISHHEADLSFLVSHKPPMALGMRPYAILMPGCSPAKPSKKWPHQNYSALAEYLWQEGITPVLVGTAIDADDCDAISHKHDFVHNLCGKTNLSALASLCANASYCVGNDSGPVFLAAKTGAPTLMLMGPDTDPAMSAPTGARARYVKADDLSHLSADTVIAQLKSC